MQKPRGRNEPGVVKVQYGQGWNKVEVSEVLASGEKFKGILKKTVTEMNNIFMQYF